MSAWIYNHPYLQIGKFEDLLRQVDQRIASEVDNFQVLQLVDLLVEGYDLVVGQVQDLQLRQSVQVVGQEGDLLAGEIQLCFIISLCPAKEEGELCHLVFKL